jgi:hypothetical protein
LCAAVCEAWISCFSSAGLPATISEWLGIRRWYQQFQTTGSLCKGKSAGRSRVSEETVEWVRQSEEICASCESSIGDVDFYLGYARFGSLPQHRLSWLADFMVFPISSMQMLG